MNDLRKALGAPFLTGHSGCPEGPHVKLAYGTVAEAMDAHDALAEFLRTRPRSRQRPKSEVRRTETGTGSACEGAAHEVRTPHPDLPSPLPKE